MYHYARMHGWTGACKRHVSVYDSAYVHILEFPNAAKRSALQKDTLCYSNATARKKFARTISRSLILSINIASIVAMIRIIIGIIITYTDTTCKTRNRIVINSKIKSN